MDDHLVVARVAGGARQHGERVDAVGEALGVVHGVHADEAVGRERRALLGRDRRADGILEPVEVGVERVVVRGVERRARWVVRGVVAARDVVDLVAVRSLGRRPRVVVHAGRVMRVLGRASRMVGRVVERRGRRLRGLGLLETRLELLHVVEQGFVALGELVEPLEQLGVLVSERTGER